jgi:O-antigen/teichoic acid export membrane protein
VSRAPLAQLGRGFLTLGAGEISARVVAFLAAAYISQKVGAANFGIISFALAAMLYAQRVVLWEMDSVGVAEVVPEGPDGERAIGTILLFRGMLAGVAMCLAALVAVWILPATDGQVIIRYALGLVFVALNARFVYLMRHRPGPPAAARLLAELAAVGMIVLLVRGPEDVKKVPLGFIVGEATASLLLLWGLGGLRVFRSFDAAFARRTARHALPLVLSSLLGLLVFNLDLIMLRFIRGPESAGYYAAAYTLVGLIMNIGIAFYLNLIPGLTRLRDDRVAFQGLFDSASTLVLMLAMPIAVGGTLLARPLILTVFGDGYAPAAGPLTLLVVASALTLFRFVHQAGVVASNRRQDVLRVNVIGAVVSVSLNVLLIPRYGILGAAASTLTTDVVRLAVAMVLSRNAGITNAVVRHLWRLGGAVAVMGAVVWMIRGWPIWFSVPAGAAVYGVGLLLFGVVRRSEDGQLSLVS